jgi:hypothetical protein
MKDFLSASGVQATFDAAVAAMARKDYALVDRLTAGLAETTGQGDFDTVYGAIYATYLERK